MSAFAVLVCGGSGTRMGGAGNKTLIPIGGIPACVCAARTLLRVLDGLVVVVRAGEEPIFSQCFAENGVHPLAIVPGGENRQASVYAGLRALPADCDTVLVHDGARPLVREEVARDVLNRARASGAAIAAMRVRDTVKQGDQDGKIVGTPDRSALWQAQTPQGFQKDLLIRAHETARDALTDDAALVEALGVPVYLVESGPENIKLTSPEDVAMADALTDIPFRVGSGYDAHRLVSGRALILCGVEIPYEKGLLGHSDADVALHALCDALLGAAALGDIGRHFPDSDERYRGISSVTLTRETARILREAGFVPVNVDVTIVAQAPKLAPYVERMREHVAEALQIPLTSVSVKATTTERMGYEGRGEGISAQATAMIRAWNQLSQGQD